MSITERGASLPVLQQKSLSDRSYSTSRPSFGLRDDAGVRRAFVIVKRVMFDVEVVLVVFGCSESRVRQHERGRGERRKRTSYFPAFRNSFGTPPTRRGEREATEVFRRVVTLIEGGPDVTVQHIKADQEDAGEHGEVVDKEASSPSQLQRLAARMTPGHLGITAHGPPWNQEERFPMFVIAQSR